MSRLQKIGEKALKLVIKYEERQGRTVKKMPQGFGYDLESRKGRDVRKIEVKATTGKTLTEKRMYNLTLKEWKVFSEKNNAWIYIVYSVRDNPQLIRIQRNHIRLDQVKVIAPQINLRFRKEQAEQLMVNAEDLSHFEE